MCAIASLYAVALSAFLIVDPDLFHEMALAREALREGALPREDPFAFTPTVSPFVHHEWGTGMALYLLTSRFGAAGLLALKYLLGLGVAWLTVLAARRRGAGWRIICLLAPLAMVMVDPGLTNVRAQFFTLLFTAALLLLLELDRAGSRAWMAPWLALHLAWLNLHGGFVVGGIVLGGYWLEQVLATRRAQWRLPACGAVMAALTLVNPYGADYPKYLGRALLMPRPAIGEWRPIVASPSLTLVFALSIVIAVYAWWTGRRPRAGWAALVLFALAAGLHLRHLSLYGLVWMAYVPAWLEAAPIGEELRSLWRRFDRQVSAAAALAVAGSLILIVRSEPWRLRVPADRAAIESGSPIAYPAGAVGFLAERRLTGNVMTPFVEGSYVSWRLHPAVKVGLDGRYEVAYRPGVTEEILAFYDGDPGWRHILGKYPVDLVLCRSSQPVRALLEGAGDWRRVYRDDLFELFARPGLEITPLDRRGDLIEAGFP
jgi:hypothetical protein